SVRPLELVAVIDPNHWHALPRGGELVHRGSDDLFSFCDGRQRCVPLGLTDDRRASGSHEPKDATPTSDALTDRTVAASDCPLRSDIASAERLRECPGGRESSVRTVAPY